MRLSLRARTARYLGIGAVIGALVIPAAAPAAAADGDPLVLQVGATQEIDSLNPYQTALVAGYDAFQLTYQLLVEFGPEIEPAPGFAESWTRAEDGSSYTFKFREGMKWSDGEPATSHDACYSFQLNLDAIADDSNIGLGYIDPSVADAGITAVECPDDTTMIMTTSDPSDRPLQTYVPILPRHIFGDTDYVAMSAEDYAGFDAPLVGSGPYPIVEFQTGQFARFARNPNYVGNQGAADEVVIQEFASADTMAQAIQAGELDYARGLSAQLFDNVKAQPNMASTIGLANGWTELGFNTYGTGTGNTIENGGPSTKALLDPLFRDALGYAINKQELFDRVLNGYGTIGTTNIPPALAKWHTPPAEERTFDIELAKQKLLDAGYELNAAGERLDKEGQPISLSLVMPDSDSTYPTVAGFIKDWWAELGITVTPQVFDSDTLITNMLPPEAATTPEEVYTADYDVFIWSWAGSPDPSALLEIFRCDAIGGSSDSMYCNEEYDALYEKQLGEGGDERAATLDQIQDIFYREAPYHILYYDAETPVWRTDQFGGWQNQPSTGTPLFTYGTLGYTLLTDAGGGSGVGGAAPLIAGGVALVAVVGIVGFILLRRRGGSAATEEE